MPKTLLEIFFPEDYPKQNKSDNLKKSIMYQQLKYLRELKRESGVTNIDLCHALGVTPQTFTNRISRNLHECKLSELKTMARVLRIDLLDFIQDIESLSGSETISESELSPQAMAFKNQVQPPVASAIRPA